MSTVARFPRMQFPPEALAPFCRKWKVVRLEAFGSVLRDDFGPDSDIDLLATFAADADWSLIDLAAMELELEALFGRSVDLLTRRSVEQSPQRVRRNSILSTARTVYAA